MGLICAGGVVNDLSVAGIDQDKRAPCCGNVNSLPEAVEHQYGLCEHAHSKRSPFY